MSERATCWSVTINNPTKSDDQNLGEVKSKSGWAVYGQKEVGENGTEHYQLMVTTPQVRFSAVKKAFPRAHIEIARDRKALTKYVNKEETRTGSLPKDDNYPSMTRLWDLFEEYYEENFKNHGCHYEFTQDKRLQVFDDFIRYEIQNGKFVETMAVNPQIRSIAKNFLSEIIVRSCRRRIDRQTTENIVEVNSTTENGQRSPSCSEETGTETQRQDDDCESWVSSSSSKESSC
jgi:Putative viral replication protein.